MMSVISPQFLSFFLFSSDEQTRIISKKIECRLQSVKYNAKLLPEEEMMSTCLSPSEN
uniref:Uncharacterized protein n=1 Tax=Arundo donax TaxID=35708 RepID=A0A0A9FPQ5_ARUDO